MRRKSIYHDKIYLHVWALTKYRLASHEKQNLSITYNCYENGKNIRQVKPLIDHRKRGNAARIHMNAKMIINL